MNMEAQYCIEVDGSTDDVVVGGGIPSSTLNNNQDWM